MRTPLPAGRPVVRTLTAPPRGTLGCERKLQGEDSSPQPEGERDTGNEQRTGEHRAHAKARRDSRKESHCRRTRRTERPCSAEGEGRRTGAPRHRWRVTWDTEANQHGRKRLCESREKAEPRAAHPLLSPRQPPLTATSSVFCTAPVSSLEGNSYYTIEEEPTAFPVRGIYFS